MALITIDASLVTKMSYNRDTHKAYIEFDTYDGSGEDSTKYVWSVDSTWIVSVQCTSDAEPVIVLEN